MSQKYDYWDMQERDSVANPLANPPAARGFTIKHSNSDKIRFAIPQDPVFRELLYSRIEMFCERGTTAMEGICLSRLFTFA